jgi:hypothetical protein
MTIQTPPDPTAADMAKHLPLANDLITNLEIAP